MNKHHHAPLKIHTFTAINVCSLFLHSHPDDDGSIQLQQHRQNFFQFHNLMKIAPPSKISPTPFLNEVVAKGALCPQKYTYSCCSTCGYIEALKKQHCARGRTNKSRQQVHDKRSIAESLHVYITRAKLTACEMGIISREISTLKNTPTPLSRDTCSW